jgi:hypothetical protein
MPGDAQPATTSAGLPDRVLVPHGADQQAEHAQQASKDAEHALVLAGDAAIASRALSSPMRHPVV